MRNMLALIGLIVVAFAGLGWYFGWYTFIVTPGSDGRVKFQGDLDTKKIVDDARKAGETVNNVVQNSQPKPGDQSDFVGPPLPDSMKSNSPPDAPVSTGGPVRFTYPGSLPGPPRN